MSKLIDAIYGAEGTETLEKAAQAKFIEKLAADAGVDVNDLSEEELEALEEAVLADLAEAEENDYEENDYEEEDEVDEAEEVEKIASAYDAMGRVMAHGFMEELEGMDKEAGAGIDAVKNFGKRVWAGTKETAKAHKGASWKKAVDDIKWFKGEGNKEGVKGARKALAKRVAMTGGLYGGATGAVGGAGYGIKKKMQKKSSINDLDALVEERALELLEASGFELEKEAAPEWLTKFWGGVKGGAKLENLRGGFNDIRAARKAGGPTGEGWKRFGKGLAQSAGVYGGAAAPVVGGVALARRGKKKKSSAIDTLAEERALEILSMFEDESLEKVAYDEEVESAITMAAFEQLAEAGYPVDDMVEALLSDEE